MHELYMNYSQIMSPSPFASKSGGNDPSSYGCAATEFLIKQNSVSTFDYKHLEIKIRQRGLFSMNKSRAGVNTATFSLTC